MTIYFSHGRKHGPKDPKIQRLIAVALQYDLKVVNVDAAHLSSAEERASHLTSLIRKDENKPFILVGTSMGGYVSLLAAEKHLPRGLFLLAPSFYLNGYLVQDLPCLAIEHFEIIHGTKDNRVPIEHSKRYASHSGCLLHTLRTDHAFTNAFEELSVLFDQFLKQLLQ